MAATSVYSSLFASDGTNPQVQQAVSGLSGRTVVQTVATTSVDDVADFVGLIPVPEGRRLQALMHINADLDSHATPTLDADLILRVTDSAGSNTDTILYNAGTGFQAAVTTTVVTLLDQLVSGSADGFGVVGLLVNTAAATAAAGSVTVTALWR